MRKIHVNTGAGYDVVENTGFLPEIGQYVRSALPDTKRILVVTDNNIRYNTRHDNQVILSLRKAGFSASAYCTGAGGESEKTLDTVRELYSVAERAQLTRDDAMLALGGGIVGDITGFAAATYLRGIHLVHVPTTVISQSDSSVGGKCGVNFEGMKNHVGTFYSPDLVYIDVNTLNTLPKREYVSGMAEIIKYGVIADAALFDALHERDFDMADVIMRCVQIKADIVEKDEKDKGLRHILNFGHTAGHALEESTQNAYLHGEGVAIGMCVAAKAGEALGITETGTAQRIENLCRKFGLQTEPADKCYISCMGKDKKMNADDTISLVFPIRIGECKIVNMKLTEAEELFNG